MFRRAWAGLERTVGQEDLAVYNTVFSLGVPCKEQSRLGEAEEMFRCCLQGYENLSGIPWKHSEQPGALADFTTPRAS